MKATKVIVIGYSGHGYVACDILYSQSLDIIGYCEIQEKKANPFKIPFLGSELTALELLKENEYFVALGVNELRKKVQKNLEILIKKKPINAIHPQAFVSSFSNLGFGILVGPGAVINACSKIGNGVICNSQSVIEHDCEVGSFSHIAPGAVLCGNVFIGENTLVGANSVIKPGIKVGNNVTIGMGTVVTKNIPDNSVIVGNPQKLLK